VNGQIDTDMTNSLAATNFRMGLNNTKQDAHSTTPAHLHTSLSADCSLERWAPPDPRDLASIKLRSRVEARLSSGNKNVLLQVMAKHEAEIQPVI
jgi:hypothetical protein